MANNYGRFQSPDTKGEPKLHRPSMLNRYVYVSNDPINLVDPAGDDEETLGGGFPDPFAPFQRREDCIDPFEPSELPGLLCGPSLITIAIVQRPVRPQRPPALKKPDCPDYIKKFLRRHDSDRAEHGQRFEDG